MRSARGHSSKPPARIGRIITPGENHHADTCTEATAMAIVRTERAKAIRRFLVMNCLVSCTRRELRSRSARRPLRGLLSCGAVTMMRAPYPIRPIDEDEFDSFIKVDEHAFHGSPLSESDRRVVLDRFEFDRTLAAFDDPGSGGAVPVGITMCHSFQLSVPGQEVLPAAGVTFVAVLPTHRRRGVLSSMMRRQLADVRDRGEPLAILWASESVIYPDTATAAPAGISA